MRVSRLILGLFIFFFIIGCAPEPIQEEPPSSELDGFASCLKESGLLMYGSMTCSLCKKQRELFDFAFHHVGEIECHPNGENPQTDLCLQKDIMKTPTWILEKDGEEIQRLEGYQSLEILSETSGCSLPEGV